MRAFSPLIRQGCAVLIAGMVAALSWLFGYEPSVRRYVRDRQQVGALTTRIAQWEAVVQASGGETAWLARNQQRLTQLRERFPQQTQLPQLLNALVEALKAGEMKLLNVTQGNVEPMQEAGNPIRINGRVCYRLPVTVTAEGRYHVIREAIERVSSEAFPAVVSLEQVELRLKEATTAKLDVTLYLYLYVTEAGSTPPNA